MNGASGGVGGFAVQLAKAMGAEVTGVCRGAKADHVRALGADHVIDYTSRGLHRRARARYDVIFDLVADHPLGRVRRALRRGGTLVLSSGRGRPGARPDRAHRRGIRDLAVRVAAAAPLAARRSGDDLAELARRIDAGEMRPVVDAVFPLERAAEAIARLESGEVRGKVVIAI